VVCSLTTGMCMLSVVCFVCCVCYLIQKCFQFLLKTEGKQYKDLHWIN